MSCFTIQYLLGWYHVKSYGCHCTRFQYPVQPTLVHFIELGQLTLNGRKPPCKHDASFDSLFRQMIFLAEVHVQMLSGLSNIWRGMAEHVSVFRWDPQRPSSYISRLYCRHFRFIFACCHLLIVPFVYHRNIKSINIVLY